MQGRRLGAQSTSASRSFFARSSLKASIVALVFKMEGGDLKGFDALFFKLFSSPRSPSASDDSLLHKTLRQKLVAFSGAFSVALLRVGPDLLGFLGELRREQNRPSPR